MWTWRRMAGWHSACATRARAAARTTWRTCFCATAVSARVPPPVSRRPGSASALPGATPRRWRGNFIAKAISATAPLSCCVSRLRPDPCCFYFSPLPPMDFLVIDDDKVFREATCLLIEDEGHYAEGAGRADLALQRLREEKFDAALLDLHLGRDDGLAILPQLLKIRPNMPVVMF